MCLISGANDLYRNMYFVYILLLFTDWLLHSRGVTQKLPTLWQDILKMKHKNNKKSKFSSKKIGDVNES
jgi:hypothetical protein